MSRVLIMALFMALLAGGQSAQAAFAVDQTGDTLDIKGPVMNAGDSVLLWGAGPGKMHVWDSGAYVGAFSSVKHVNINVWGHHPVIVRMLAVEIKGDAMIATGNGGDDVLFIFNEIRGLVAIDSGGGDDMVDAQHNSLNSSLYVSTGDGDDETGLYDNEIARDAIFETGAGDDGLRVGYDHVSPIYPANTIKGDLYVDGGDDDDAVEVAFGAIAGNAILNIGPGECEVFIRDNDIRGDLSLATSVVPSTTSVEITSNLIDGNTTLDISGDLFIRRNHFRSNLCLTAIGGSYLRFLTNVVESDSSFDLGTEYADLQYIYFENRNQFVGNLSINISDSWICIVYFLKNIVEYDMTMSLASSGLGQDIYFERNLLLGNVNLGSTGSVYFDLERNRVEGTLNMITGDDWDVVSLTRNTCNGNVTIDAGGGDDDVELGNQAFPGSYTNTFNVSLSADGGAGSDTLYHDVLNSYAIPPSSLGFEAVIPF